MKKNLSLILALVMILGSFSSVFAAVAPVETPVDAGAFLKDKGVLVGNAEGDLMLDELLARQDAVILVAQLRGMVEAALAYPGDAGYEDVKDPFYNGPLKWAQDEGLFVGRTEKVFGFDDNLTVQEYAKVLLTALGYSVGPNGGVDIAWDKALDKAEEFGILANLKDLVETDGVKRGDMALMTFNALSVMMKDGKMTLAESLKIEMPEAAELKAEVNDTVNLKEVVVELSNAKLADKDKLMDESNYRVNDLKVKNVSLDGNNLILLLQDGKSMIKDKTYDLTIRAIDTKINGKYSFKAKDNTSPKVEKVQVLGEYGIKVTFTEPVEIANERDFLIDGKNIAMEVEPFGRDLILTPYHNTAFASDAKTLTVEEVTDFAGYKSALEEFSIEIVKDNEAPKVEDVVIKGNVVEVTFDKDVYKKSVKGYENRVNEGNISYREGRVTVFTDNKAAKKVDTNKVEYTFKNDIPRNADLTIEGVQNHSKVAMEKVTMQGREIKDNLEPEVIDVDITTTAGTVGSNNSKAKITIEFDKNVKGYFLAGSDEAFAPERHFTIYEREVANRNIVNGINGKVVSAKYEGSKRDTIVVELENLRINEKREYDYILEIVDFEDSNRNRMYRYFYDFSISEDDEDLKIIDISLKADERREEIEVRIDFNEPVDEVLARDTANHYLFMEDMDATNAADSVRDLEGKIEVAKNGKEVYITIPDYKDLATFKADYKQLKVFRTLKDKDGNRLDKDYVFELASELEVGVKGALDAINAAATSNFASLTSTDFANAAIVGVNDDNLAAVKAELVRIAGGVNKGWKVSDIQGVVDTVVNALEKINTSAKNNNFANVAVADFELAGVTGVTNSNLAALKVRLASLANGINQNWTVAQIQGVVDGVEVEFSILTANGANATTTTTELVLTLDQDINLVAGDITVTGATLDTVTDNDNKTYKLAISDITVANDENVIVSLSKAGFTITPASRAVKVFKDTTAPQISTIVNGTGDTAVVTFNEKVDKTAVETAGNWTLTDTSATITGATLATDGVTLTVEFSEALADNATLLAKPAVVDLAGNAIDASKDLGTYTLSSTSWVID